MLILCNFYYFILFASYVLINSSKHEFLLLSGTFESVFCPAVLT
jgi:hypothetical protein